MAEECAMLRTLAMSLALGCTLGPGLWSAQASAERAQGGYSHGVFIGTPHGPIELTAYAEVVANGQLRMAKGSRENIPTLSDIQRVLCNLPNWQPGAIMIANQEIFIDDKAERRELRFAVRRLNISALELKVEDLERKDRLARLMQGVGASETSPAYAFVVMVGNGLSRFYPFRVRLE
jgi:hypothetical protein